MKGYKLIVESSNLSKGSSLNRCVGVFDSREKAIESLTLETLEKVLRVRNPSTHLESMKGSLERRTKYRFTNFYPATVLTTVAIEESEMNKLEDLL